MEGNADFNYWDSPIMTPDSGVSYPKASPVELERKLNLKCLCELIKKNYSS
jgi:hypothetical protein